MMKSEFITRVRQARTELDALMDGFPADRMEQPGVNHRWSLKDLLAHIAWYEREMVDMIRARAFAGSDLWGLNHAERNQAIHDQYKDHALEDVRREAQETLRVLFEALETLTDADLNDPASFPGMPADWLPGDVIASNTYEHYEEHIPQVRDWQIAGPSG